MNSLDGMTMVVVVVAVVVVAVVVVAVVAVVVVHTRHIVVIYHELVHKYQEGFLCSWRRWLLSCRRWR